MTAVTAHNMRTPVGAQCVVSPSMSPRDVAARTWWNVQSEWKRLAIGELATAVSGEG